MKKYKRKLKESLNPRDSIVLKKLVKSKSLWDVLDSLRDIAEEISYEVAKNMPEEKELSKSWSKDAKLLENFMNKISN